jgi:hypothetical protein
MRNLPVVHYSARVKGGTLKKDFSVVVSPFFCAAEKPEKSGICSKIDHRRELDTWFRRKMGTSRAGCCRNSGSVTAGL